MENQRNNESAGAAVKVDQEKLRWDLIPWEQLEDVAWVFDIGCRSREPNDWQKGMSWSRYFSATMRHLMAYWWKGENLDPDTGKSHLAHAIASLLILMWYDDNAVGVDNRPKPAENKLKAYLMDRGEDGTLSFGLEEVGK